MPRARSLRLASLWALSLAACGGSSSGGAADAASDGAPVDTGPVPDAPPGTPGCSAPATFADGKAPTRVLHVAPGASAGGDGSPGAPFATIAAAAAAATPGTAIRLAPGTHATGQFVDDLRGTADAPIWLGGEPGQALPVIEGGGEALHLTRPAYVVVHDLEVRGQASNGINIDDGGQYADPLAAHHVLVERVYIHDVGTGGNQDCLKVSGVNDLFVYDARIERCSSSGVDHVGCHRSVIARTTFDDVEEAVQAKGGSEDVDVRECRIRLGRGTRALNMGGSTGFEFFRPPLSLATPNAEARRIRAFNNVITGLAADATPFAFVGCVDCLAAHNLVRGQQRWHLRILQETVTQGGYTFEASSGGRVISNVFEYDPASLATAVNVGANTDAGSFTFATNVWTQAGGGGAAPSLPTPETGGVAGQPTGYGVIPDEPRAPITGAPSAAAIAGGAALPEVPGTLLGACRPAPPALPTRGPLEAAP